MFSPLSFIINRLLKKDPRTEAYFKKLEGKRLRIEITDLNLTWEIYFKGYKLKLARMSAHAIDTVIKGSFRTFSSLLFTDDPTRIRQLTIEGDLNLSENVYALLTQFEIDWEEQLSQWIPDIFAHQFFQVIQKAQQKKQRVVDSLFQNVSEYVQEEAKLSISKSELNEFMEEVDCLRDNTDRLNARLLWLEQKRQLILLDLTGQHP